MNPLNQLFAWLSSAPFLHVAGLASLSTLTALEVIAPSIGVPLIVGLIGLGINTTSGSQMVVSQPAPVPVVQKPATAPAPAPATAQPAA